MRMVTRVSGLVVAGILTASSALAQGMGSAKHEFGVDLTIQSSKVDVDGAKRRLEVVTPVDVRLGFVTSGKLMFETRFNLSYSSSDGTSSLNFDPGINLLWRLGESHQSGAYLTGGAKVAIARSSNDAGSETETRTGINVGIGTRKQWGMAALRPEVFYSMLMEKDASPARSAFGVRIGLSFWH